MRYATKARIKAAEYFDMGYADNTDSRTPGVPGGTVVSWLRTYRALGKEALFITKYRSYDDTQGRSRQSVVNGGLSKSEAMVAFGIGSKIRLNAWCRLYRKGGPDVLLPESKGRPKKTESVFSAREEELEARVHELELENEILKRFNTLAEEIEQKRQTR